jgi:hypothetical protein
MWRKKGRLRADWNSSGLTGSGSTGQFEILVEVEDLLDEKH